MFKIISFLLVLLLSANTFAAHKEGSCEDKTEFVYWVNVAKEKGMTKEEFKKNILKVSEGQVDQKSLDQMMFLTDWTWAQHNLDIKAFFEECQKADTF